jgi:hypothetical protein
MTAEDKKKARDAIIFLVEILKRRGIEDGCALDYTGGSSADDLRFLGKMLELDLGDV